MVHWLALHAFNDEGLGSVPGWRSKILHTTLLGQKKEKETLFTAYQLIVKGCAKGYRWTPRWKGCVGQGVRAETWSSQTLSRVWISVYWTTLPHPQMKLGKQCCRSLVSKVRCWHFEWAEWSVKMCVEVEEYSLHFCLFLMLIFFCNHRTKDTEHHLCS